jgi:hypothetical protein
VVLSLITLLLVTWFGSDLLELLGVSINGIRGIHLNGPDSDLATL